MRKLSEDLRLRAVKLIVEEGLSRRAVGQRLSIGEATVGRWVRQYRLTGSVAARPRGNPGRSRLDPFEKYILGLIEGSADITLVEIVECLYADHGVKVQPSTLWRFLRKRGLMQKNRLRTPVSRAVRASSSAG